MLTNSTSNTSVADAMDTVIITIHSVSTHVEWLVDIQLLPKDVVNDLIQLSSEL
jgi:hypothetical protein